MYKVVNSHSAGAIGVIIVNNYPGSGIRTVYEGNVIEPRTFTTVAAFKDDEQYFFDADEDCGLSELERTSLLKLIFKPTRI